MNMSVRALLLLSFLTSVGCQQPSGQPRTTTQTHPYQSVLRSYLAKHVSSGLDGVSDVTMSAPFWDAVPDWSYNPEVTVCKTTAGVPQANILLLTNFLISDTTYEDPRFNYTLSRSLEIQRGTSFSFTIDGAPLSSVRHPAAGAVVFHSVLEDRTDVRSCADVAVYFGIPTSPGSKCVGFSNMADLHDVTLGDHTVVTHIIDADPRDGATDEGPIEFDLTQLMHVVNC